MCEVLYEKVTDNEVFLKLQEGIVYTFRMLFDKHGKEVVVINYIFHQIN